MFDHKTINKDIPVPLYYQLQIAISDQIKSGKLVPGDKILKELEIVEELNISRTTVRQAIQELVNQGLLYRIRGKGTYVAKPKITQDFLNRLESFNDQILRLNMVPSTKVLSFNIIDPSEEVAATLNLINEKVIEIVRIRYANDDPIVYVKSYLPLSCSFIFESDLNKDSLYFLLSKYEDTKIVYVTRQIEAILSNKKIGKLLNIETNQPIQFTKTIGYTKTNDPLEFSLAYYPADKNKFTVKLTVE